jgi:hypothetical protein
MPQFSLPQTDISNNGWTPVGAGSLSGCLNDVPNSDATYVASNPSPTGDTFEVKLAGVAWPDPNDPTPTTLTVRLLDTLAGSDAPPQATIVLLQGQTPLASWVVSPPSGFESYTFTVASSVLQQITNYNDLRVRVTAGPVSDGCCNNMPPALHFTVSGPFGGTPGCTCWPDSVTILMAWDAVNRYWFGTLKTCDEGGGTTTYTLRCISAPPTLTYSMTLRTDLGGGGPYNSLSVSCSNPLEIDFAINGQTSIYPTPFYVSPNCYANNAKVTL